MTAPDIIKHLVEQFERDLESYRSAAYKEAQLRQGFLNPFFEALGWDMSNKSGRPFADREVIHEDAVKIEGEAKSSDYAFIVGRERKFFVEAKKPFVKIESDTAPAYQLRRYAWHKSLPLSILTDFEEFAVYDCRFMPKQGDQASMGRVMLMSFRNYLERWDEIANIFSREAVGNGSFDKYAEAVKSKKGTIRIDEAFLADIEKWRDILARNIALRTPDLSVPELNYAVQVTIDRIIFLRICEDRGIERNRQLQELLEGKDIYEGLIRLFQKADARYNSGLFHFKNEKEQSSPADSLTLKLKIDDKAIKEILERMYPPSPYMFKEIPTEILGKIYEQFLGKVIRLTTGGYAKVDFKPEVKKAGGVFYTPTFIVSYIVVNTLGKLLMGLTPKEAAKLRIIDPACGSGTFLLGAYQYLLDWHLNWYVANDPEKWASGKKPALYLSKDGYRLTGAKKKEILLHNIYGVDIDAQAVEVTKLSLLLKVLEDESNETIGSQLALFQERVLPDLGKNIKCGNSLIGHDYWEEQLVTQEEKDRVNAFDWKTAFPDVFAQGGFDVVIGNPPYIKEYVSHQPFHDLQNTSLYKYYQGKMDIWYIFACLAIDLLKKNGLHSFIATNNWITNSGASIVRSKILSETQIHEFVDFGNYHVFESAGIQTMVYLLEKTGVPHSGQVLYRRVVDAQVEESDVERFLSNQQDDKRFLSFKAIIDSKNGKPFTFVFDSDRKLLDKIRLAGSYFLKSEDVAQGIVLPQDFVLAKHLPSLNDQSIQVGDGIFLITSSEFKNMHFDKEEKQFIKPFFTTQQLQKYYGDPQNELWVIYTDSRFNSIAKNYPHIKSHLDKFRSVITSDNKPYGLHRARDERFFLGEKIISLRKTDRPRFTYVDFPCYVSQTFFAIKPSDINLKYLSGLLNSRLSHFWLNKMGKKQGDALQVDKVPLLEIPIRPINFSNPADKARHDKIVPLVERMLELHKRNPRTPQEKESLAGEVASVDRSIDELVYQLYGLTEDEIKIVEGK